MNRLDLVGRFTKYANIGGSDHIRMIPQATKGATIVAFNCHNCLTKTLMAHTCDSGFKLGIGRFGDLVSIRFVEPLGDSVFGMWRCSVRCAECNTVQDGVHYGEAPSHEPYIQTDLPREWKEEA